MLDKINMSTRMSFNTSCISTDGTAAEYTPAGSCGVSLDV